MGLWLKLVLGLELGSGYRLGVELVGVRVRQSVRAMVWTGIGVMAKVSVLVLIRGWVGVGT